MSIAAATADAAAASDASATAMAAVTAGTGKAMGQSAGGPWQLVREKKFPMPPIAIEEAIVCLEYIEHGFCARRPHSPHHSRPPSFEYIDFCVRFAGHSARRPDSPTSPPAAL